MWCIEATNSPYHINTRTHTYTNNIQTTICWQFGWLFSPCSRTHASVPNTIRETSSCDSDVYKVLVFHVTAEPIWWHVHCIDVFHNLLHGLLYVSKLRFKLIKRWIADFSLWRFIIVRQTEKSATKQAQFATRHTHWTVLFFFLSIT